MKNVVYDRVDLDNLLDESYVKNTNQLIKKHEISFDSSSNQFSQTGTPLTQSNQGKGVPSQVQ